MQIGLLSKKRTTMATLIEYNFSFLFLFFKRFNLSFREKGGRKKGRETFMLGGLSCTSLLGTWLALQACALDWELNWSPFGLQACTQSTEPHWPRLNIILIETICFRLFFLRCNNFSINFLLVSW